MFFYIIQNVNINSLYKTHFILLNRLKMYLPNDFCAKRASEVIVELKEMLLSFSIGTFLTNYDVTNRKHEIDPIYSFVRKWTI